MKKKPLLVIEYDDITGCDGWQNEKRRIVEPLRMVIVGWKVRSNKENIMLVPHRYDDNGKTFCEHRHTIPKGCIRSIRRLE